MSKSKLTKEIKDLYIYLYIYTFIYCLFDIIYILYYHILLQEYIIPTPSAAAPPSQNDPAIHTFILS